MKFFIYLISTFIFFTLQIDGKREVFRYPAINGDGSEIAFTFQGDIWRISSKGGEARRLTIHKAYDGGALWDAEGKEIIFYSKRNGREDIYSIPRNGGLAQRLTWHSSADIPTFVKADGGVLFNSSRVFKEVEWMGEIYTVSKGGGTPYRFSDSLGSDGVISGDGNYMAFVRGVCRTAREAYNGPADRDIWVLDIKSKKYHKLTSYDGNDFNPKWQGSAVVYYLSSKSGKYNIWKVNRKEGSKPEQVTFFKDFGIESFDLSRDGNTIVFNKMGKIFTMKTGDKTPKPLHISVNSDYRYNPVEFKTLTGGVRSYDISDDGKYTAFISRGEVFVTSNKKGNSITRNITNTPYKESETLWLKGGGIVFVRDNAEGDSLYIAEVKGSFLSASEIGIREIYRSKKDIASIAKSEDSAKLSIVEGRGSLVVFDIDYKGKLSNKKQLTSGWSAPGNITWSPDNRWVAYSRSDLDFNREIYIQNVAGGEPVNVSMHPRSDHTPFWSPDGKKIGFISNRNNGDDDVWFAWLNKRDWEKSKTDWQLDELTGPQKPKEKASQKSGAKKKKLKGKTKAPKKVTVVDTRDIYKRLVQVTSMPGDERGLAISRDGKWLYYVAKSPSTGKGDLYKTKWDLSSTKRVTRSGSSPYGLKVDSKGSYLYMVTRGGKLSRLSMKSGKSQRVSFKGKMKINHLKEKELIFKEASAALKKNFYDPGFHGVNWDDLVKRYRGYVLNASTNKDFMDLYNIMIGQLNASHMGMYMRPREKVKGAGTGLLGVELVPEGSSVKVVKVIDESPAGKVSSKLYAGDKIVAVNGMKLSRDINFYSLMEGKTGEMVLLKVEGKNSIKRSVSIRPVKSLRRGLYNEWVNRNRKMVDKLSGGKLGYLHIQGMNWTSFERFEREITAAGSGKEGIMVDVRYNGGGWTTDYLMAVLNVKQHAYTIPRGAVDNLNTNHKKYRKHYAFGERLPFAAWTKPSIALCNECSYSNAEIFSHAYKTLGIGKLVGRPTFGAVISTGGIRLMDGSSLRMPFRAWYVKATGENMENGPAVPHIVLENLPDEKIKGKDSQLKRAVEELLKDIK